MLWPVSRGSGCGPVGLRALVALMGICVSKSAFDPGTGPNQKGERKLARLELVVWGPESSSREAPGWSCPAGEVSTEGEEHFLPQSPDYCLWVWLAPPAQEFPVFD